MNLWLVLIRKADVFLQPSRHRQAKYLGAKYNLLTNQQIAKYQCLNINCRSQAAATQLKLTRRTESKIYIRLEDLVSTEKPHDLQKPF